MRVLIGFVQCNRYSKGRINELCVQVGAEALRNLRSVELDIWPMAIAAGGHFACANGPDVVNQYGWHTTLYGWNTFTTAFAQHYICTDGIEVLISTQ